MTSDLPRRRFGGSIRLRVTAVATIILVAALALAGALLVVVERRSLTQNLEDAIEQRSADLQSLLSKRGPADILEPAGDDMLAQVVRGDGTVLAASAALAGAPPLVSPAPRRPSWRDIGPIDATGDRYRVLSRTVPTAAGTVQLNVAGGLDDIADATRTLTVSLLVGIPALAAGLAALAWWLVGRTLRPVEAIRAEVAAIDAAGLHRRVPQPAGNDEVARLAETMNQMLQRVEAANRRQRQFVADASHELRTPLTRMQAELEVSLADAAGSDRADTCRSVLDETRGLEHLVDGLLLLARTDGEVVLRTQPVDLDDLVFAEARRRRDGDGLTWDISGVHAVQVEGDPAQLERAIGNVAENAARYATSSVRFELEERDGLARLAVIDDGPGIAPEVAEVVFERFVRLDEARSVATGGAGLGLAITREILERHGGTISVDGAHVGGARIVMTLPVVQRFVRRPGAT